MEKRKKIWTRKRPIAVTIVAWGIVILFAVRLFQVFEPLVRMHILVDGLNGPLVNGFRLTLLGRAVATSGAYLALSIIGLIVLIGFLRVHRWAWVVLMAWTGASLAISLVGYLYGRPNYLVMASNTIIALALNQVEVQRIFHIRIETVDQHT